MSKSKMSDHVRLMTAREAADALALSVRTLRTLCQRGELTPVRIGRSVRFDPNDLRRLIDERKEAENA